MSRSNPFVRLRPGVRSSSREDGLLQVGHDPRRRVLLPDTVSVRQALQLLVRGLPLDELGTLVPVGRSLLAAGLVVDEDEHTLLADARRSMLVEVIAPEQWRTPACELLHRCGLGVHEEEPGVDIPRTPDATLLVQDGDPDRELIDHLLRGETPVLPVSLVDARVRVGPFIMLGTSTCLRCLDAHAAERDPWFRSRTETLPVADTAVSVPPLVLMQALVTATADLCAWAEGRQPRTWCATRTYDEALAAEETAVARHPYCGCTWADGVVTA